MIILTLIIITILLFLFLNINNNKLNILPPQTSKQKDVNQEIKVFQLVNEQRASRSLNSLTYNETLANISRKHSQDMYYRNYVDHNTPEGETPTDRLNKNFFTWKFAGENILVATNTDADNAIARWMNSQEHRDNILSPNYGKTGVGLFKAPNGVYYWTQLFTD